jgi:endogenous inhibitor of DNA gyrase (YacG/DUF329 family)
VSGKAGRGAGTGRSAREITCPACGKPTVYAESNPSRPFCSPRCRLTDLGGWASEAYRIPARPAEDEGTGSDEEPKD